MGLHCLVRTFLQEEDPMTFFFSQTLGLKTGLLGTPENTPLPAVPRCPAAQRSVVSLVYHRPWRWL